MPPTALMLLAIVSVQLGSALATVLFSALGPVGTAFATSLFSALALTLARRRGSASAGAGLLGGALRRHLRLILLFGLVDAGMVLPFFLALERIPLGIASTITFLGPLGLAVATSRRLAHFLWIGVAGVGVALLTPEVGVAFSGAGAGLDPLGIGYAALAALAWAAFVPVSKSVGRVFPGHDGLALGLWVSALLLLPVMLAEAAWAGGGWIEAGPVALLGSVLGAIAVALVGTVLPLVLEFKALRTLSARRYGVLVTLEPAVGAMVGMAFLGQPAGLTMLLAVACVTVAALGITLTDRDGSL